MSLPTALLAGWLAFALARRWRAVGEVQLTVGGAAALLVWQPLLGAALSLGALALVGRAWLARRRQEGERVLADLAVMGELVLLGLTAGLSLSRSLELAAEDLGPGLAAEVRGVLRRARRIGLGAALGQAEGHGRSLYVRLARAQLTGAAMAEAVAAFVHEQRDAERARRLEAARRLPVRLMIPLALLMLPGFVVLTVGPAVLTSVRRLVEPFG
ncbi:MAG: type II secretion system F family protein [Actinomycetota bacterium]|nr:type II secretion system F family protein [Actinomycetota bacterium]